MTTSAEVHEMPLANRIIDRLIGDYIALAGDMTRTCGTTTDYERGIRAGADEMQYLHLSGYDYCLTPKILDELRRAGLLVPASEGRES